MGADMYKVSIITRREKLIPLLDALGDIGVKGVTITSVEGFGTQLGLMESYRGVKQLIHLLPKILVETVVSRVPVDDVVEAAKRTLQTGEPGDGKLYVSRVTRVVRVRTGEEDADALRNAGEEDDK
ncbi:MAG: P-II family nitrogen regulator [Clostridiales Family XIII bacterium]|jgi:nitrogen regulatory protein PII|nr:P-II family nitrogen regulator [Clostridiales Family XIII bacterium]